MAASFTFHRRRIDTPASALSEPQQVKRAGIVPTLQTAQCIIRILSVLLVLGLTVLFQGCAKPYSAVLRQYNEAPVCCSSLAELPVEPLRLGDSKSFDMEGSPAYRFSTGKSYFRAFALPTGPYPYKVTVRSFLMGDDLRSAYFFFPRIITLDGNRSVVRTTGTETFTLHKAGYFETMLETAGLQHKLEGELNFPDGSLGEKYLVILTTSDLLKATTPVSTVGDVPTLTPGYSVTAPENGNEVRVAHGPGGRVSISLVPTIVGKQTAAGVEPLPAGPAKASLPPSGPEVITVRLENGTSAGTLELGHTTIDTARTLFENAGTGQGTERQNTATFTIGSLAITPKRLFTPPGTRHQLYFDDSGTLVLFVDGSPAGLPTTGSTFRHKFSEARESGRNQFSYELQVPLSTCVTLIAHFSSVTDSLEFPAYVYACRAH